MRGKVHFTWNKGHEKTNAKVEENTNMVLEFEHHNNTDRNYFAVRIVRSGKRVGVEEVSYQVMNRTAMQFGVSRDIKGNEEEFLQLMLKEASYVDHYFEKDGWVHHHTEGLERPSVKVLDKCTMDEYFNDDRRRQELP